MKKLIAVLMSSMLCFTGFFAPVYAEAPDQIPGETSETVQVEESGETESSPETETDGEEQPSETEQTDLTENKETEVPGEEQTENEPSEAADDNAAAEGTEEEKEPEPSASADPEAEPAAVEPEANAVPEENPSEAEPAETIAPEEEAVNTDSEPEAVPAETEDPENAAVEEQGNVSDTELTSEDGEQPADGEEVLETEETELEEESEELEEVVDEVTEELEEPDELTTSNSNGFEYTINNQNEITITGYTGSGTDISIPNTINGYKVRYIGQYAFADLPITTVVIPGYVTDIGRGAFKNCTSLKKVTINAKLLNDCSSYSINGENSNSPDYRYSVFYNAGVSSGMEVVFGKGVNWIPAYLFATGHPKDSDVYCRIKSVTISNTVTYIGEYAFAYCYKLTTVKMGAGIQTIGNYAFDETPITSIVIPAKVTNIGTGAFRHCTSLKKVTINAKLLNDCSSYSINGENSNSPDYRYSVFYNAGVSSGMEVVFGKGVNWIPAYLFATGHPKDSDVYCKVKSVTIPDTVTYIGEYAFAYCYKLTTVKMGTGIQTIGNFAFDETPITSIVIPAKVTGIGRGAFRHCTSLKKVTINAKLLNDCSSYSINGENSNSPDYRYSVFYNAGVSSGMEVVFGKGVTYIPAYLFATGHPKDSDVYCRIKSVTIPDTVTNIGKCAFFDCYKLSSVIMGKGVVTIGESSFENTAITGVSLPATLKTIDDYAFYNTPLTSITIPANVTSINRGAFSWCTKLKKVTINAKLLNDCSSYSVNGENSNSPDYRYSVFYNAGISSGMEVVFGKGVTRIPAYLFATGHPKENDVYCTVKKVTIPASVKSIGECAFYSCFKLKDVYYGASVKEWDELPVGDYNGMLFNAVMHFARSPYYHMEFVTRKGRSYWYEYNKVQGTTKDPKGVWGDGINRGREIYDSKTKAWYWLDSVLGGAKATGKEVWMPYVYQNEGSWTYQEVVNIAKESDSGMEDCVREAILNREGKWVRYDGDGKMLKGWVTISGDLAKLYPKQAGNTYYYDTRTGLMAKGWCKIGYHWYHFDETSGKRDS